MALLKKIILFFSLFTFSIGIFPQFWSNLSKAAFNFLLKNTIFERYLQIFLSTLISNVNQIPELPSWRLLLIFGTVAYVLHLLYMFLFDQRLTLKERIILHFFYCIRNFPIIRGYVESEINKTKTLVEGSFDKMNSAGPRKNYALPRKGLNRDEILRECEEHAKMGDCNWRDGRVSGAVYMYDVEHKEILHDVYSYFAETNPLHPEVFPGVRKMEAEIVSMCLDMYNGDNGECGVTTSGGTESILMAMKAYREVGYSKGIKFPEIIMAISAHSAFMKAASYFGMRAVRVKVDKNYSVDIKAMEKAITRNTVVLVVSAPSYPHGIIEPVEEIAKLGLKYNIGVHVDCCLGGFLLPFMKDAGYSIPDFDFTVNGVTSISCDTHKYGYGPKGCSVILYRNSELRANQYFVDTDWSGGIYASPAIAGSRSGVTLACTWAAMIHMGREGYIEKTKEIVKVREEVEKEVRKIPEVMVFGQPKASVLAIGSKTIDIFRVSDHLSKRGWHLNNLQFPAGFHICFTAVHIGKNISSEFVEDLKECIEVARGDDSSSGDASQIYGTSMKIPDRGLVGDVTNTYLNSLYKV